MHSIFSGCANVQCALCTLRSCLESPNFKAMSRIFAGVNPAVFSVFILHVKSLVRNQFFKNLKNGLLPSLLPAIWYLVCPKCIFTPLQGGSNLEALIVVSGVEGGAGVLDGTMVSPGWGFQGAFVHRCWCLCWLLVFMLPFIFFDNALQLKLLADLWVPNLWWCLTTAG